MGGKQDGGCLDQHRAVQLIDKVVLEDRWQALKTLYVTDGVIVFSGLAQRLFWERRAFSVESISRGDIVKPIESENESEGDNERFTFRVVHVERMVRIPRYAEWLDQVDDLAFTHWRESDYTKKSGALEPGDSWIEWYLEGLTPREVWELEVNAASMWADCAVIAGASAPTSRFACVSLNDFMR